MLRTLKFLFNACVFLRIEIKTAAENIVNFLELHWNTIFLEIFSVHIGFENFHGFFKIFLVNQGEVRSSIFFQPTTSKHFIYFKSA